MRTTLVIPDAVYRELKRRAAETGRTISGLATELLRRGLAEEPPAVELPPLPTFSLGPPLVDVADREALYDLFDRDGDWWSRLGIRGERRPASGDAPTADRHDRETSGEGEG